MEQEAERREAAERALLRERDAARIHARASNRRLAAPPAHAHGASVRVLWRAGDAAERQKMRWHEAMRRAEARAAEAEGEAARSAEAAHVRHLGDSLSAAQKAAQVRSPAAHGLRCPSAGGRADPEHLRRALPPVRRVACPPGSARAGAAARRLAGDQRMDARTPTASRRISRRLARILLIPSDSF